MNYKTTLVLAIAVIVAAFTVAVLIRQGPPPPKKTEQEAVAGRLFAGVKQADIHRIEIQRPDKAAPSRQVKIVLELVDGKWRIVEPVQALADRYQAGDLATKLADLNYSRTIDLKDKSPAQFGLEPPACVIRFTAGADTHELHLGCLLYTSPSPRDS